MIQDKAYPVFHENQVLTEDHLNNVVRYLELEDRESRIVAGSGICCGLNVGYETESITRPTGSITSPIKSVTLSIGAGTTSKGYLIVNPIERVFNYYQDFILPENSASENYLTDGAGEPLTLYELLESNTDPDDSTKINNNALRIKDFPNLKSSMAVILHLEIASADLATCKIDSCDNEGYEKQLHWRALLISKDNLNMLIIRGLGLNQNVNVVEYFTKKYDVREVRIPRPSFKCENTQSYDDIHKEYLNLCQTAVGDFETAFGKSEAAYRRHINSLDFDIETLKNHLVYYNTRAKDPKGIQYFYDHLKDVAMALNEFNDAAFAYHCDCSLNKERYPNYLMAGSFVELVARNFTDDVYRHYFEPCCKDLAGTNQKKDLINLYERVNVIIKSYRRNFIEDSKDSHSVNRADQLFITAESRLSGYLGDLALPYYYNKDSTNLRKRWNPHKFARGQSQDIPFYLKRSTTNAASWIDDPNSTLRFRLDKHDCFHIEGHLGKTKKQFKAAFEELKKKYGLPVDLKVLEAKKLEATEGCEYEQPYTNLKELNTLYDLEKKEILCFLGKLFDYFKRFHLRYIYAAQPDAIALAKDQPTPSPMDAKTKAKGTKTAPGVSTTVEMAEKIEFIGRPQNYEILESSVNAAHTSELKKNFADAVANYQVAMFKTLSSEDQKKFVFSYTDIDVDGQKLQYFADNEAYFGLFLESNMLLSALSLFATSINSIKNAFERDSVGGRSIDDIKNKVNKLMDQAKRLVSRIERYKADGPAPVPIPGPTPGPTVIGTPVDGLTLAVPTVAGPIAGPTLSGPAMARSIKDGPTLAVPTTAVPAVAAPHVDAPTMVETPAVAGTPIAGTPIAGTPIDMSSFTMPPVVTESTVPGPAPGPTPVPTPGPTPGPAPVPIPGPTPGPAPVPAPVPIPGPAPGPAPVPIPGPTPGPAPVPIPGPAPVPTPVPIPGPTPGPAPGPPEIVPPIEKCVILPLLTSIYSQCWASKFLEIKKQYQAIQQIHAEEITFPQYVHKHPGIEHIGGVPKGGTFIVVYETGGDEIVADFCLPYICCSDTSSVEYIVFAELKMDLPEKICNHDEEYKINYSPNGAILTSDTIELSEENGSYSFNSGGLALGEHNITISLGNKSVTSSIQVIKHPEAEISEPVGPAWQEELDVYVWTFGATKQEDGWTYKWYKRNLLPEAGEFIHVRNGPTYVHKSGKYEPVKFELRLNVSNSICTVPSTIKACEFTPVFEWDIEPKTFCNDTTHAITKVEPVGATLECIIGSENCISGNPEDGYVFDPTKLNQDKYTVQMSLTGYQPHPINIYVLEQPSSNFNENPHGPVLVGNTYTLTIEAEAKGGDYEYQWFLDRQKLSNVTGNTYNHEWNKNEGTDVEVSLVVTNTWMGGQCTGEMEEKQILYDEVVEPELSIDFPMYICNNSGKEKITYSPVGEGEELFGKGGTTYVTHNVEENEASFNTDGLPPRIYPIFIRLGDKSYRHDVEVLETPSVPEYNYDPGHGSIYFLVSNPLNPEEYEYMWEIREETEETWKPAGSGTNIRINGYSNRERRFFIRLSVSNKRCEELTGNTCKNESEITPEPFIIEPTDDGGGPFVVDRERFNSLRGDLVELESEVAHGTFVEHDVFKASVASINRNNGTLFNRVLAEPGSGVNPVDGAAVTSMIGENMESLLAMIVNFAALSIAEKKFAMKYIKSNLLTVSELLIARSKDLNTNTKVFEQMTAILPKVRSLFRVSDATTPKRELVSRAAGKENMEDFLSLVEKI